MRSVTPEELDSLLPQTQCGLCGYGGCMPYAEAMVFENAPINLCPPGGMPTLIALSKQLEQDPTPFLQDMVQKAKPPLVAQIREAECIGCTKCISACPVDAIIGSAKQMHVVVTADCTGCELCVPPCPVDCIDMQNLSAENALKTPSPLENRKRYHKKLARVARENKEKEKKLLQSSLEKKKNFIEAAILRAKAKKIK